MFERFRHYSAEGGAQPAEERSPSHDELLMKNNIQRGLMDKFAKARGHESTDPRAKIDNAEWIQVNAGTFAHVYEDIQENEPYILDNWPDHASLVYEEISKRMEAEMGGYQTAA